MNEELFDRNRYEDGTFKWFNLYLDYYGHSPTEAAVNFAINVSCIREIKSRQVAAIVLVLMDER